MNNKKLLIWAGIVVVVAAGAYFWFQYQNTPGQYDAFAECINISGAKFYGTFWCSHCQNQKKAFGKSAKLLPYIECSTPDGNGQLPVCADADIKAYPTWVFADGSEETGELSFQKLAEKTSCQITQ